MKWIKQLLFLVVFAIFGVHSWAAEPAPAITKEQEIEIRRMLRLTGMEKLVNQMVEQLLATFKAGSPDVPDEIWTGLREEMQTKELYEKLLPLYAKYYSVEDLRAINEFYESVAGQHFIAKMPQAMQEAMVVGGTWGEEAGKRVDEKIRAAKAARASPSEKQNGDTKQ